MVYLGLFVNVVLRISLTISSLYGNLGHPGPPKGKVVYFCIHNLSIHNCAVIVLRYIYFVYDTCL